MLWGIGKQVPNDIVFQNMDWSLSCSALNITLVIPTGNAPVRRITKDMVTCFWREDVAEEPGGWPWNREEKTNVDDNDRSRPGFCRWLQSPLSPLSCPSFSCNRSWPDAACASLSNILSTDAREILKVTTHLLPLSHSQSQPHHSLSLLTLLHTPNLSLLPHCHKIIAHDIISGTRSTYNSLLTSTTHWALV